MLFKIGYRNLWRNRRRTLLTMSAMALATGFVIFMLGMQDGMIWDMINGATENYNGHARLYAEGYRDDPQLDTTITESGLIQKLKKLEHVKGASPRLVNFAILSAGDGDHAESQPAQLLGINPQEEKLVTRLYERIESGKFLSDANGEEIVLGVGLAKRLGASIGDEIAAMGQGADGSVAQALFTVVGVVDSGDPARDAMLALVSIGQLQEFSALPGQVHEYVIALDDPMVAKSWAVVHQAEFENLELLSWQQLLPLIAQMQEMWAVAQYIFTLIFYFAVILVAANTMSMSFFERMREFAIMGAIGMMPFKLAILIVFEGLVLSLGAALTGGIGGTLASFYFNANPIDLTALMGTSLSYGGATMQPQLQSQPTLINTMMPVGLIIVLGVVVSLIPAFRLKQMKPVEALTEV